MAFDQNSVSKDLRQVNVSKTLAEGTLVDNNFTGIGQNRCHVIPNGVSNISCNNLSSLGENGDCKKVKFLCSFGGKIFPRPSYGMLRYVGGHTRIIGVKRDVSFVELVNKVVSTYGQNSVNSVIKYQLPDEDLDVLVSVMDSEDLENMMEEYEKFSESSVNGSGKLRIFLFSLAEVDGSRMGIFGDLQDSGNLYMDAVNRVSNFIVSGGIKRNDESASVVSIHNSDFSGPEAVDASTANQSDVSGPLSTMVVSPNVNLTAPQSPLAKIIPMEPRLVDNETSLSTVVVSPKADSTALQDSLAKILPTEPSLVDTETSLVDKLDVPIVESGPQSVSPHHPENGVEPPVSVSNIQHHAPYFQTFVDPHHPPLMGFPSPVMGTIRPIYNHHPQFPDNASGVSPQYMTYMPMAPHPSQASMRPNMVPVMQPQQDQFGTRIIQLPNGQRYHAYSAQTPSAVVGGAYGWHQVPQAEQVVLSEGWLPSHAHLDMISHGQRTGTMNPTLDSLSPVYRSIRVYDKTRVKPMSNVVDQQGVVAAHQKLSGHMEKESVKSQANLVGPRRIDNRQSENDRMNLQKSDITDHQKTSFPQDMAGFVVDGQSPYAVMKGNPPQHFQENVLLQQLMPAHYPCKQQITMYPPVNNDIHLVHESPKKCSSNLLDSAPKDVTFESYNNLREIDERIENLWKFPPESIASNDQIKPPRENVFIKPITDLDSNHFHPNKLLPPCTEAAFLYSTHPVDSFETSRLAPLGNPTHNQPPALGIKKLSPEESSYGNNTYSGVNSAQVAERVQLVDWAVDPSQLQPKLPPVNVGVSALSKAVDTQGSSSSLFSNQDPWDFQHDNHLRPPLPNKIMTRKEGLGMRAPLDENQFSSLVELPNINTAGESSTELRLDEVDYESGHTPTTKGSAEEQIRKDLQGVVGVAAFVLETSTPSDLDLTKLNRKEYVSEAFQDDNVQNVIEQKAKSEEEPKTKPPEKADLGFPASDGLGHLQIIKNSDLEQLRELGSGTFGTVYHGKWRGSDVAIKRINERCFTGKPLEYKLMKDDFWNEAIKLADLHHPNVVAFYGVVMDGSVATVTEYMANGSLRTALQKNERNLDKRKRLFIAMDVAFGMEYLHGKNIVHFDLKGDNLLVNLSNPHRPICKVGDLGLSKVKCQTMISGGVRGTLPWMAPELLNGSSTFVSDKVDVFSFGIVMWELITGEEPYADLYTAQILGGIVNNTLRPPMPESCDPEWRSLMERCWSTEPSERPSFSEIASYVQWQLRFNPGRKTNSYRTPHSLKTNGYRIHEFVSFHFITYFSCLGTGFGYRRLNRCLKCTAEQNYFMGFNIGPMSAVCSCF